jgi:hypothetical protein
MLSFSLLGAVKSEPYVSSPFYAETAISTKSYEDPRLVEAQPVASEPTVTVTKTAEPEYTKALFTEPVVQSMPASEPIMLKVQYPPPPEPVPPPPAPVLAPVPPPIEQPTAGTRQEPTPAVAPLPAVVGLSTRGKWAIGIGLLLLAAGAATAAHRRRRR